MSPLWQARYSLDLITFFISPWPELKWQLHFVIFSAHICVNRIHLLHRPCTMSQFLVVRTRFYYPDLTPPVFQDPAVKLTNQGQAKFRYLGDQHHQNILVPSSRVTGLGHQSHLMCGPRESNRRSLACEAVTLHMS